jgi:phosphoglucomutase
VEKIVRQHWAAFGRNYYTRHDYEGIDTVAANTLMNGMRDRLDSLPGRRFDSWRIADADDFCYTDPVDHSVSEHQGIRIRFDNGARIVYRLSGTGTEGATLRVYIERFEADPARHDLETATALAPLIALADKIAGIEQITGRHRPDVIT